jgi:hypothetical protein
LAWGECPHTGNILLQNHRGGQDPHRLVASVKEEEGERRRGGEYITDYLNIPQY